MEKNKEKDKQEKLEEVAKVYGLSLKDIEHIKLENGHEFFKFKDPKDQSIKMIEHTDYNTNMSDVFKNEQNTLSDGKTKDENVNAKNIYGNLENKNKELNLITITEFRSNEFKYKRIIRTLKSNIRKQLIALISKRKELNLEYINIEYGIGINEDGEVLDPQVDNINRKINIKSAEVVKYDDKTINVDQDNYEVELKDEELDSIIDEIVVVDDEPIVEEPKDMNVGGEKINTKVIVDAYNNEDILNSNEISDKQKNIYSLIIKSLKNKLTKKATKKLVLNNNNNNRAA